MFKSLITTTLITSTLLITACATTPSANQHAKNLSFLQNKNWALTQIGATAYKADPKTQNVPYIQFGSDLRVSGADGCNRIAGQYAIKGQHITLGQLAGTRMLCQDAMQITAKYNEALNKVAGYQVYDKTLRLLDQYGNPVLQFSAQ